MGQSTKMLAYQATRSSVIGKVEHIQGQWNMEQSTKIGHTRSTRSSVIGKKMCAQQVYGRGCNLRKSG